VIPKNEIKFELDNFYSKTELLENGMGQLNNKGLDYTVFQKNLLVYFFEQVEVDLFRLFCITGRKSFYLS